MKKRFISFIIAAAVASAPLCAMAEGEASPKVFVDNSEIIFADQNAVIQDGSTLVPARGVFEAMGATVLWDEDTRTVVVDSESGVTRITLTIDDPLMKIYTYGPSLFATQTGEVSLDVTPQILNNRTMVPLRAISEALQTDVDWNAEKFEVDITTNRHFKTEDETIKIALSADKDTVAAGETFDLFLNISNMAAYPDHYVSSLTAAFEYDKNNFEIIDAALMNGDAEIENGLGAINSEYTDTVAKAAYTTISGEDAAWTDGKIMKFTVKSINGKEGSFTLANIFSSALGTYDTYVFLTDTNNKTKMCEGTELVVDPTPVVINAGK